MKTFVQLLALVALGWIASAADAPAPAAPKPKRDYQYKTDGVFVPAASADEPRAKAFGPDTIRAAAKYLDDGALAWTKERSCIACHTNGSYMSLRPGLTSKLGKPQQAVVDDFVAAVPAPGEAGKGGPAGSVWRSAGLAEYDRHVTGKLSPATDASLRDMFQKQEASGCWRTGSATEIPHITTDFELTVKAAQAASAAPGWIENLAEPGLREKIGRLKDYLRDAKPRNDYERILKLQAASCFPGVIAPSEVQEATELLWKRQHGDGGWSLRDMSEITNWRDKMNPKQIALLQGEPDAAHPVSDAYMTGFAITLLRESGVPATDERLRRGIGWLKSNQRASGRWWMKSVYTDNNESWHFSTYIATCHAMKALGLCGELERVSGS